MTAKVKVKPVHPWFLSGWAKGSIFLLGILLYLQTITYDYTLDDAIVIYENQFTTSGIKGIGDILGHDTFYGFFKEAGKSQLVSGGRYRPLSLIFFAIEWQLFGRSPGAGHALNLLLYGLLCLMVYLAVERLLAPSVPSRIRYPAAWITAILFAAHPVHTEAVANIKGMDEILALLACLFALYLAFKKIPGNRNVFFAGLIFLLGLLAKENAITWVAVIPVAYVLMGNQRWSTGIRLAGPWLAAAAVYLILRQSVLEPGSGQPVTELMNNPFLKWNGSGYVPMNLSERLGTTGVTWLQYLRLMVFPLPLTHDYYPRQVAIHTMTSPAALTGWLLYLAMAAGVIYFWKKQKVVSFGLAYYLITFSIVSNLIIPIGTNMSERFLFMPGLGILLIAGYYWALWIDKVNSRMPWVVLGLLVLAYGMKTVVRNTAWKDNFTLFKTDIAVSSNSAKLNNALGGELSVQAAKLTDETKRNEMLNQAIPLLQKALEIHPTYRNALLLLGNTYFYLARYEEAIASYQKALAISPGYREAEDNLQLAYREGGKYFGEKANDIPKALTYLQQAYTLKSNDYETLRLLGVAYGISGNTTEAVIYFQKALDEKPDDTEAMFNYGTALLNSGQTEKGNQYIQKAIEKNPEIKKRYGME